MLNWLNSWIHVYVNRFNFSSTNACEQLLGALEGADTPGKVDKVIANWSEPADAFTGFTER